MLVIMRIVVRHKQRNEYPQFLKTLEIDVISYSTKEFTHGLSVPRRHEDSVLPESVMRKLQDAVERYVLGEESALESCSVQVPAQQSCTASAMDIERVKNLVVYGFERVREIQQSSGNGFVLTGKDGKPTDELLMGSREFLKQVRELRAKTRG